MNKVLFAEYYNMGYANVRAIDGVVIGTMRMLFTYGLFVGLNEDWYQGRYCYEFEADCVKASQEWDGKGDPPGPWIKYKGEVERLGPGAVDVDAVWNIRPWAAKSRPLEPEQPSERIPRRPVEPK